MTARKPDTVRANVYESDPLALVVERVGDDDEWTPYYELPAGLVEAYEQAEKTFDLARAAIEDHIETHRLAKVDPQQVTR